MERVAKSIDKFTEKTGQCVAWICVVLVAIIGVDVLLRYVFNQSYAGLFELEWHLFGVLFMLAMGYTLKHDRHVRVDVFYGRFSPSAKAWVNLVGATFFLIPFCVIIIKTSIPFVMASYSIAESSADPGGLPYRFVVKSMIPLGAMLLLLQAISEWLKSITTITANR